jgi:hypothetical protein
LEQPLIRFAIAWITPCFLASLAALAGERGILLAWLAVQGIKIRIIHVERGDDYDEELKPECASGGMADTPDLGTCF